MSGARSFFGYSTEEHEAGLMAKEDRMRFTKERLEVAHSGTITRGDLCAKCKSPLLFAIDEHELVRESFCGNRGCLAFLVTVAHEE